MLNFRCKLNEFCQLKRWEAPVFVIENPSGPPHNPSYNEGKVSVRDETFSLTGSFNNKKDFMEALAKKAYEALMDKQSIQKPSFIKASDLFDNSLPPAPPKKDETDSSKKELYLIDLDNGADIKKRLDNLSGEVHVFIAMTFNQNSLTQGKWFLHVAPSPVSEIVDHMITAYCFSNLEKIKQFSQINIVSRDKGLNALVELLKHYGLNCKFMPTI